MSPPRHAAVVFIVALVWLGLTSGAWTRIPIYGDAGVFAEYASRVADGQVPHVDFYEVKPTGFLLVAWPFIQIGRACGLADWLSVRCCSLAMVAGLAACAFLAVRGLLARTAAAPRAIQAGWLAALAILAIRGLPDALLVGLQPKLFTLLFPFAGMGLLFAGRPAAAGFSAAFTPFHWQPGALAWLLPLALAMGRPAEERAPRKYLLGSTILVALYGVFLLVSGSFGEFLDQAVFGAFGAVGSEERGSALRFERIARAVWMTAGWELLIALPLVALAVWRRRVMLWPIAAMVVLFGIWSLLDFQGTPDVTVLALPLLMIAGAECGLRLGARPAMAAGAGFLLVSLIPHSIEDDLRLERQQEVTAEYLTAVKGSRRPIFALGNVFLPLLAERRTIGTELFGYGLFARQQKLHPGGADGWVADRFAENPAGVLLGRGLEPELVRLVQRRLVQGGWILLDTVIRDKDIENMVVENEIWVRAPRR